MLLTSAILSLWKRTGAVGTRKNPSKSEIFGRTFSPDTISRAFFRHFTKKLRSEKNSDIEEKTQVKSEKTQVSAISGKIYLISNEKNSDKREKTQLKSQKTQVSAILQEIERQKSVQKKACCTVVAFLWFTFVCFALR